MLRLRSFAVVIVTFVLFTLPATSQVNPIQGYTLYEFFEIMDVYVPADWVEIPIEDIYPDLSGGEAGMAFSSPEGRLAIDVFRDSVTDAPGRAESQRELVEENLYTGREILESDFVQTISGRVFYFDSFVLDENGEQSFRQLYYVAFASERIYQMVGTLFPNEDGQYPLADITLLRGILDNVYIDDRSMSGGDPEEIAIEANGFRAVVPADWEQSEPSGDNTLIVANQPDDLAFLIMVDGGSYDNPAEAFLENTANNRYSDEGDEIINSGYLLLPLDRAFLAEATSPLETNSGDLLSIYNQDYHLLVNGTEFIGIYLSVDEEDVEEYADVFFEIARSVIPVSGEVVAGAQFE